MRAHISALVLGGSIALVGACGESKGGAAGAAGQASGGSSAGRGGTASAAGKGGEVSAGTSSAGAGSGGAASGGAASGGAASGGAAASGAGASTDGGAAPLVDCDERKVVCKRVAPECGTFEVPSVEGNCYGECVKIERCACDNADACPNPNEFTCWNHVKHCGPFVR